MCIKHNSGLNVYFDTRLDEFHAKIFIKLIRPMREERGKMYTETGKLVHPYCVGF